MGQAKKHSLIFEQVQKQVLSVHRVVQCRVGGGGCGGLGAGGCGRVCVSGGGGVLVEGHSDIGEGLKKRLERDLCGGDQLLRVQWRGNGGGGGGCGFVGIKGVGGEAEGEGHDAMRCGGGVAE